MKKLMAIAVLAGVALTTAYTLQAQQQPGTGGQPPAMPDLSQWMTQTMNPANQMTNPGTQMMNPMAMMNPMTMMNPLMMPMMMPMMGMGMGGMGAGGMGMGNPVVSMMNPSNWTNPGAYMSFMNPNTYAAMMNPMSYMAFMNPATYMPLMNPASYMSFMNPMAYMQWMNPAAYAIPGMTGAGGANWFDPSSWGSMVPMPQIQQQK